MWGELSERTRIILYCKERSLSLIGATMTSPASFEFPIAKAQYLLNRAAESGEGEDKRKFWREVMGFESPEAIPEAILTSVSLDMLQPQSQNPQGELY